MAAKGSTRAPGVVRGRWDRMLARWLPYATLGASVIVGLLVGDASATAQWQTIALAGLAAAWVYAMHTRAPEPRHAAQTRMRVYFVGFVALGAALMLRQPMFFVFALTGFFHASVLRPWWVVFVGVGATSVAIHTIITGFPWATAEATAIFVSIIVLQTVFIGFGIVISDRVAVLSEHRRQAVARLEAALEENAALHAQLMAQAREAGVRDERQRLAREIHDTITQGLIGIVTQLEAARQSLGSASEWQRHVANAEGLARESLAEARRSVAGSHPEALERGSLPEALGQIVHQWSTINGVAATVTVTGDAEALHPEVEAAIVRTAQEALANVAKHAAASRVGLTLSYMGDAVTLDVRDDGCGFDVRGDGVGTDGAGTNGAGTGGAARAAAGPGTGFGLTTMRQRVGRVAGVLAIESEPGAGTAVSARIPAIPAAPAGASASERRGVRSP